MIHATNKSYKTTDEESSRLIPEYSRPLIDDHATFYHQGQQGLAHRTAENAGVCVNQAVLPDKNLPHRREGIYDDAWLEADALVRKAGLNQHAVAGPDHAGFAIDREAEPAADDAGGLGMRMGMHGSYPILLKADADRHQVSAVAKNLSVEAGTELFPVASLCADECITLFHISNFSLRCMVGPKAPLVNKSATSPLHMMHRPSRTWSYGPCL